MFYLKIFVILTKFFTKYIELCPMEENCNSVIFMYISKLFDFWFIELKIVIIVLFVEIKDFLSSFWFPQFIFLSKMQTTLNCSYIIVTFF